MRYRKLDTAGDYSFGHGQFDFYTNVPEAVAQAAQTRLLLWTDEWFLDLSQGTPWETQVVGKVNPTVRDQAIRTRILGTPGLRSIISFSTSLDVDTRHLSVLCTIDTLFGPASVSVTLGPVPFTIGTSLLSGIDSLE